MGEIDKRLQDLIREVEGTEGVEAPSRRDSSRSTTTTGSPPLSAAQAERSGTRTGRTQRGGGRWLPAFVVLLLCNLLSGGLGYWLGQQQDLQNGTKNQETPAEQLRREGWQQDGSGVFYRWCSQGCHAPRLYGGGLIREFQVRCLERPCGDLAMQFEVLNVRGEILDTLKLQDNDVHQGEERRFYVESPNPQAASFRLTAFIARARV